jgi:NADPH:quinone reductase-like Zn-dependent oxidoreductase
MAELEVLVDVLGNVRKLFLRELLESRTRRVLTPEGTLVLVAPGRGQWIGPVVRVLGAILTSRFGRQQVRPFLAPVSKENLLLLKELIEAGKLKPVIDRTYPFNEIPEAVRYVESGNVQGKVVITV